MSADGYRKLQWSIRGATLQIAVADKFFPGPRYLLNCTAPGCMNEAGLVIWHQDDRIMNVCFGCWYLLHVAGRVRSLYRFGSIY